MCLAGAVCHSLRIDALREVPRLISKSDDPRLEAASVSCVEDPQNEKDPDCSPLLLLLLLLLLVLLLLSSLFPPTLDLFDARTLDTTLLCWWDDEDA